MVEPIELMRQMLTIRIFEEILMARSDHGFQLLSTGEEAVAVGLCQALAADDQLLTSGRAIGPAIARGVSLAELAGELLGRTNGTNRGLGGRGHLAQPAAGFFGAHAVVAGNVTVAAGVALANRHQGSDRITVCILGDGATAAGSLHETLNLAALWRLPLLLVVNNNHVAISTPVAKALAVTAIADLAAPFGIPAAQVDGMDVLAVRAAAAGAVAAVRSGQGPYLLECHSERLTPHSTSTRETRSREEMAALWARCPIQRLQEELIGQGTMTLEDVAALRSAVAERVNAAFSTADAAGFSGVEEALHHVW